MRRLTFVLINIIYSEMNKYFLIYNKEIQKVFPICQAYFNIYDRNPSFTIMAVSQDYNEIAGYTKSLNKKF